MDRIASLQAFLSASPGDNFLEHALALEYSKAGNEAEARRIFETILLRDPGYIGSYYHLAKLLERTGEKVLAREWYQKGMVAAKTAGDNHAYGELRAADDDLMD
jgi:Tfp pilus assembly protein PilF